jgi:hypothetical protein
LTPDANRLSAPLDALPAPQIPILSATAEQRNAAQEAITPWPESTQIKAAANVFKSLASVDPKVRSSLNHIAESIPSQGEVPYGGAQKALSSVAAGFGLVGGSVNLYKAYKASDNTTRMLNVTDGVRAMTQSSFDIVKNCGVKAASTVAPGIGVAVNAAGVITNSMGAYRQYQANNELSARINTTLEKIRAVSSEPAEHGLSAPSQNNQTLNAALVNVLTHTGTCLSNKLEAGKVAFKVDFVKAFADGFSTFASGVLLATAVGAMVVCPPLAVVGVACGLAGLLLSVGANAYAAHATYSQHQQSKDDAVLKNAASVALQQQPPLSENEEGELAKANRFFALVHLTRQLQDVDSFTKNTLIAAGVPEDLIDQLRTSPLTLEAVAVNQLAKALYGAEISPTPAPAPAPAPAPGPGPGPGPASGPALSPAPLDNQAVIAPGQVEQAAALGRGS